MQQRLRGRPPLPFRETVPGRIHSKLGSLNSIIWRLRFGGENRRELLQSAGVNLGAISRQRDSQIIKSIFEHAGKRSRLSHSHHPQWRLARFLRGLDGFQDEQKINSLARRLVNQGWVNKMTGRAGSFKMLIAQIGIPRKSEDHLRRLLQDSAIKIPKAKRTVTLRCRICRQVFTRSVYYERRFASSRKKGPLCGIKHL